MANRTGTHADSLAFSREETRSNASPFTESVFCAIRFYRLDDGFVVASPLPIFLRGFLPLFALRVRQFRKHSFDSAGVSLQRLRFICQKFHDTGSRKHSEAPPTDCRQVNAGHAAAEMLLTDVDPVFDILANPSADLR